MAPRGQKKFCQNFFVNYRLETLSLIPAQPNTQSRTSCQRFRAAPSKTHHARSVPVLSTTSRIHSAKRAPSGRSVEISALPRAGSMGSPSWPSKKACSAVCPSRSGTSSQSMACTRKRTASKGAVASSISAKVSDAAIAIVNVAAPAGPCLKSLSVGRSGDGVAQEIAGEEALLKCGVEVHAPMVHDPVRYFSITPYACAITPAGGALWRKLIGDPTQPKEDPFDLDLRGKLIRVENRRTEGIGKHPEIIEPARTI